MRGIELQENVIWILREPAVGQRKGKDPHRPQGFTEIWLEIMEALGLLSWETAIRVLS